jgi:lactoylglutathione lyase
MTSGGTEDHPSGSLGGVRVSQLRVAVTATDFQRALQFYRDVLGMPAVGMFTSPSGGQVVILDAGRATLELADPTYAAYIDEVEVGERVAGHIRVALEVPDAAAATNAAQAAGARLLAPPTVTPWNSSNARLEAPAGLQLTLFTELDHAE